MPQTVHVFVTGFGQFAGVENNPTAVTAHSLQDLVLPLEIAAAGEWVAKVARAEVMEVATEPCDATLQSMASQAATLLAEQADSRVVILNLGVAAGASSVAVEATAYNEANFRVQDAHGVQLRGAPIDPSRPLGQPRHTALDAAAIAARVGGATGCAVVPSTNPGRFLCNWAYYRTLSHVEALNASAPNSSVGLFVHVPMPTAPGLGLEQQREVALALIKAAAAAVVAGLQPSGGAVTAASSIAAETPVVAPTTVAEAVTVLVKNGDFSAAKALEASAKAWGDALAASRAHATAVLGEMGFPAAVVVRVLSSLCDELAAAFDRWGVGDRTTSPPPSALDVDIAAAIVAAAAEEAPSAAAAAPSPAPAAPSTHYKLVVVVRDDLGMGKGKIAAQVAHAALKAYRKTAPETRRVWESQGEPIVVVRAENAAHLQRLAAAGASAGVLCSPIRDAGRTQVEPGTVTVMAVGPGLDHHIDAVTGSLKLL